MSTVTTARTILTATDHTRVARQAIDELFRTEGGRSGLWVLGGDFWAWEGGRWTVRPRAEVEKKIIEWIEDAFLLKSVDAEGVSHFGRATDAISGRDVREITWIIERLSLAPTQSVPRWVDAEEGWPDPDHCIAFQDVVMDVKATAAGKPTFLPRDDRFFGPGTLTVPYLPAAGCQMWEKCQSEWSGGDKSWQEVRERFYGYCLMGTRKYGKALLEQGKTQSGKGSGTNDVLSKLFVGSAYHSTRMDDVIDGFGLDGLHQCQVWVTSEVRDLDRGAGAKFATLLKVVLGRDLGMVNIKNVRQLKGVRFRCAPILQSNPMPSFPDDGGAVTSKLVVLPFRNSFADPSKRDPELPDKLARELPGIAARFAEAAVRLEQATGENKFPVVAGAAEVLAQIALEGNPCDAFLKWAFVPTQNKMAVSQDYIFQKRLEFETETGVHITNRDRKVVKDNQLLLQIELASSWQVKRVMLASGKWGLVGVGMKGIK